MVTLVHDRLEAVGLYPTQPEFEDISQTYRGDK